MDIFVCLLFSVIGGSLVDTHINTSEQIGVYIEDSDLGHQEVVLDAMNYWKRRLSVNFKLVNNMDDADIVVRWTENIQGKGEFNGRGGYIVMSNSHAEIVLEYFDNSLEWWLYGKRTLRRVATHEFGHALGLQDTNKLGDVMNPKGIRIPNEKMLKVVGFVLPLLSIFMVMSIVKHYVSYLRAKRKRFELEKFMKENGRITKNH